MVETSISPEPGMLIRAGEQMAFVFGLVHTKSPEVSAPSWMTHIIIVDAKKQNIRLFKMWMPWIAKTRIISDLS